MPLGNRAKLVQGLGRQPTGPRTRIGRSGIFRSRLGGSSLLSSTADDEAALADLDDVAPRYGLLAMRMFAASVVVKAEACEHSRPADDELGQNEHVVVMPCANVPDASEITAAGGRDRGAKKLGELHR
jgi:hypothetical protein